MGLSAATHKDHSETTFGSNCVWERGLTFMSLQWSKCKTFALVAQPRFWSRLCWTDLPACSTTNATASGWCEHLVWEIPWTSSEGKLIIPSSLAGKKGEIIRGLDVNEENSMEKTGEIRYKWRKASIDEQKFCDRYIMPSENKYYRYRKNANWRKEPTAHRWKLVSE